MRQKAAVDPALPDSSASMAAGIRAFLTQLEGLSPVALGEHLPAVLGRLEETKARLLTQWLATFSGPRTTASAPPENDPIYLSVEELSRRIGYAQKTVYNWVSAGILREGEHFFRRSRRGRLIFSWAAMQQWVEHDRPVAACRVPMLRDDHGASG